MLVPRAVIIFVISWLESTLFNLAFSTFNIFPFKGNIAWNSLFLPCFAEPPAESPSTMNNSDFAGSCSAQSASFPGSVENSRKDFLLVNSLAFLAASLALAANNDFSIIVVAIFGFSSRQVDNDVLTILSTIPFISLLPSFVFVWPSNCGSGTFIDIIAVNPSLTSSLLNFIFSLKLLLF